MEQLIQDKQFKSQAVTPLRNRLLGLKAAPIKVQSQAGQFNLQGIDIFQETQTPLAYLLQSPVPAFFYETGGTKAQNLVWNNKPVFFIRLHGSYPQQNYHLLRRTAVTELANAYIVFADNYLVRHIWELHFFGYFNKLNTAGTDLVQALQNLITSAKLNVAGRLVEDEKSLAFFRQATPHTTGTDLYFSHYFDVCGNYSINGSQITYQQFYQQNQSWLSAGLTTDWTQSQTELLGRKIRKKDTTLTNADLAFLRAYNVRLLSPQFVFAFPYSRKFKGTLNQVQFSARTGFYLGEKPEIRRLFFQHFYQDQIAQNGGSAFKLLMQQGGVPETDLQQMLYTRDFVDLESITDSDSLASPILKNSMGTTTPGNTNARTVKQKINIQFPTGGQIEAANMPAAVAAILSNYAAEKDLINAEQLVTAHPVLEGLIFTDNNDGQVTNVHSGESFSKDFPNSGKAFRITYSIGADTGILTTQWRSGDNDNFGIFKQWASDEGYVIS